jgi:hypothetical protein
MRVQASARFAATSVAARNVVAKSLVFTIGTPVRDQIFRVENLSPLLPETRRAASRALAADPVS